MPKIDYVICERALTFSAFIHAEVQSTLLFYSALLMWRDTLITVGYRGEES